METWRGSTTYSGKLGSLHAIFLMLASSSVKTFPPVYVSPGNIFHTPSGHLFVFGEISTQVLCPKKTGSCC